MTLHLSNSHQRTLDAICAHPTAHGLHWRDVQSLLRAAAVITDEGNGKLRATYEGRTILLHPESHGDTVTTEEVAALRQFFRGKGTPARGITPLGLNVLVVIDHAEARLYRTELRGTVPERIEPFDPHGTGRFLHNIHDATDGRRRTEIASYYEAIAKALEHAERVLIFGGGKGGSSAMDHLVAELTEHHKELADRIVGTIVVDEHHLTENELLSKAREYYANVLTPSPAGS